MDIKALGWHLSADKGRVAQDTSKLKLITEICRQDYPEYLGATQTALDNIDRERRESAFAYNPYAAQALAAPVSISNHSPSRRVTPAVKAGQTNGSAANGASHKHKQGGLFGGFFKFGKKHAANTGRSQSVSAASSTPAEDPGPPRALSDSGPVRYAKEDSSAPLERARSKSVGGLPGMQTGEASPTQEVAPQVDDTPMEDVRTVRSKSVGEILEIRPDNEEEEVLKQRLERLNTNSTVEDDVREGEMERQDDGGVLASAISRHDQFHGLGRQGTKVQS